MYSVGLNRHVLNSHFFVTPNFKFLYLFN